MRGVISVMLISNHEQEDNLPDHTIALAAQLGNLLTKPMATPGMDVFDYCIAEFMEKRVPDVAERGHHQGAAVRHRYVARGPGESAKLHLHFDTPPLQVFIAKPSFFWVIAGLGRNPKNRMPGNELGPLVSLLLSAHCTAPKSKLV